MNLKDQGIKEIDTLDLLNHQIGIKVKLSDSLCSCLEDTINTKRYSKYVGISELFLKRKIKNIDIFRLSGERRDKFNYMLSAYKREQTKVGCVTEFYLENLKIFKEYGKEVTAPEFSRFIKRDRTRTINVLRRLQKEGIIEGKRIKKTGRPFVFEITEKGNNLLNKFAKRF